MNSASFLMEAGERTGRTSSVTAARCLTGTTSATGRLTAASFAFPRSFKVLIGLNSILSILGHALYPGGITPSLCLRYHSLFSALVAERGGAHHFSASLVPLAATFAGIADVELAITGCLPLNPRLTVSVTF